MYILVCRENKDIAHMICTFVIAYAIDYYFDILHFNAIIDNH